MSRGSSDRLTHDEQEALNTKFNKELKYVYGEIDKKSYLLWCVKDEFELINYGSGLRSSRRKEDKDISNDWQKNTNA